MNDEKAAGIEVAIGPFRGAVHPGCDSPGFRAALADIRARISGPAARILLDGRNLVVSVPLPVPPGAPGGTVVKEFRPSGFKKLKTIAVPGKAVRAWRGAAACRARGIPTPFPMAWLERRERGVVAESYYVAAAVPDAVEIRGPLRELASGDLDRLIAGLAGFLNTCHERGILHRDLSDGNILVRSDAAGAYEFSLIDTNRIRVRRRIYAFARIRNLVRLGVPPECREFFLDRYLGEKRRRKALRLWYAWAKGWYAGVVAFRKKLRLKKLAERLGIQ
jgi:hypothetical protein